MTPACEDLFRPHFCADVELNRHRIMTARGQMYCVVTRSLLKLGPCAGYSCYPSKLTSTVTTVGHQTLLSFIKCLALKICNSYWALDTSRQCEVPLSFTEFGLVLNLNFVKEPHLRLRLPAYNFYRWSFVTQTQPPSCTTSVL